MSNQHKQNESRKDRERDYFANKVMAKKAANPAGDWRTQHAPSQVPGTLQGPTLPGYQFTPHGYEQVPPSSHPEQRPVQHQHPSAPSTKAFGEPSPEQKFGQSGSRPSWMAKVPTVGGPYSRLPTGHPALPRAQALLQPHGQTQNFAPRMGIPSWKDVSYDSASSGDVHHSGVGRSELDPSVRVTRVAPREEQKGYKPTYKGNYTHEPWNRRNEERMSRSQVIRELIGERFGIE